MLRRRDEILRHIKPGALRLLIYEGQPQPGAGGQPQRQPSIQPARQQQCPLGCCPPLLHPTPLPLCPPHTHAGLGAPLLPTSRAGAASKVVTAAELAAADIVLTSYDVLRRDVNHCPDEAEQAGAGRSLRWRKKYEASGAGGWAYVGLRAAGCEVMVVACH